jgi:hypothetical protein
MDHANNIGAGNFQMTTLAPASNPPIKKRLGDQPWKAIQTQ